MNVLLRKVFAGDAEVERACLPGWVDLKRDDGSFLDPDGGEGGAEKVFDEGREVGFVSHDGDGVKFAVGGEFLKGDFGAHAAGEPGHD